MNKIKENATKNYYFYDCPVCVKPTVPLRYAEIPKGDESEDEKHGEYSNEYYETYKEHAKKVNGRIIFEKFHLELCRANNLDLLKAEYSKNTDIVHMKYSSAIDGKQYKLLDIALDYGFFEIARFLVDKGANTDEAMGLRQKALLKGIENNDLTTVKLLLEIGIDNIWSMDNPLMTAAKLGHLEILQFMIEKGWDINTISIKNKNSAILQASEKSSANIIRCLLILGCDANAKNDNGETAFQIACRSEMWGNVEELVDYSADVKIDKSNYWNEAVRLINKNDLEELIKCLKNKPRLINLEVKGWSLLDFSVCNSDVRLVKYLRYKGCCLVKMRYPKYQLSLLPQVYLNDNVRLVECLNAIGFSMNYCNRKGESLLFMSIQVGSIGVVKFLLNQAGAASGEVWIKPVFMPVDRDGRHYIFTEKGDSSYKCLKCFDSFKDQNTLFKHQSEAHSFVLELNRNETIKESTEAKKKLLFHASKNGSTKTLECLLLDAAGTELNVYNAERQTPLIVAAKSGSLEAVQRLISQGALLNFVDEKNKESALHVASQANHIMIIEYLLSIDGNINGQNRYGETALMVSGEKGNLSVVKLLIRSGAKINAHNKNGQTAIFYAARENHLNVVKFLVESGADVDSRDNNGHTIVVVAAETGQVEVLKYLTEQIGSNIDFPNFPNFPYLETPLLAASREGHLNMVEHLILKKANVNALRTIKKESALHAATQNNHSHVVKHLLVCNARTDVRNCYGQTPLFIAAKLGNVEIVDDLIYSAIKIGTFQREGTDALFIASCSGRSEVVRCLIKHGIDIESKDTNKKTPLFIAAEKGCTDVVKTLINLGAQADVRDSHQDTPLLVATKGNHTGVVECLARICNINDCDFYNQTAISIATKAGYIDILECLKRRL
ncbi:MAG: ankyrin repeat domain-containing protein [Endozoicomonadaceae bacterium]|nr:ankyrin repeat domain-containing protein [Endozoicomonadaceae bacterium]